MMTAFEEEQEAKEADAKEDAAEANTWSEDMKAQSPAVKEQVRNMQTAIDEDQSKWRDGLVRFSEAYRGVHEQQAARMAQYTVLSTKLQRNCERLRDALDRLLEAKDMCSRMQDEELPGMFKISAKDPKRFKRFGDIQGCVRMNFDTGLWEPDKCECLAGMPSTGCIDAVGKVGNTLSCTHILETQLPSLPMAKFFEDGGECSIKNNEAWNDAIIPGNAFDKKPAESSVGLEALSLISVLQQQQLPTSSPPQADRDRDRDRDRQKPICAQGHPPAARCRRIGTFL
jgi:hypothetical protein